MLHKMQKKSKRENYIIQRQLNIVNINILKSPSFLTFLSLTFLYQLTKSPKCICLILSISNTTIQIQALYQFTAELVQ